MKRAPFLLFPVVAILFGIGGAYVGYRHQTEDEKPATAGATLFALELPDDAGSVQKLSQWRGKPLIVNFWATWCPPCVEEMPALSDFQKRGAGRVQVIGIGIDTADNIRGFARKYSISYPLYVAGMRAVDLSRQMGNPNGGLPFTLLINKQGALVKTYMGRLDMDQLRGDLDRL